MMQQPRSMEGTQASRTSRRYSDNGVHGSTTPDTDSRQESPIYEQLRKRDSPLYQNIASSPSDDNYRLSVGVRERGPTLIKFQGPAPCEEPVTLESGESQEARGKMRTFINKVTGRRAQSRPEGKQSQLQFCPDPYVGSRDVTGLHSKTFSKFLKRLDAVLVLFYNPFDDNCRWAKLNVREAAGATQRENHAYAAVDCTKECQLCRTQGIKSFPTMKLFSKGRLVNTYGSDTVLLSREIQTFVERVPVSEKESRRHGCPVQ
ncbi:hypothetical protein BsWGS_17031 [Bradybaena similaris]